MGTSLALDIPSLGPGATIQERLSCRSTQVGDCIVWMGYADADGYGRIKMFSKGSPPRLRPVHRVAYETWVGPIPDGLTLDHLCRNRRCINPRHLEPVTNTANTLRGVAPSAINAAKTHCKRGHPFDDVNTRHTPDGHRECITCQKQRSVEKYARKKARLHS